MVGDPALRVVVGADLGRAVAGAHHGAPLLRAGGFLLGDHPVEEARPQHLHRLRLVLQLGLLVLLLHHEAGGDVGDAHRAVGGVHALAAGTGRAEDVDLEVVGVDADVHLLGFRQHGHRGGGGVDPPLRLGGGNALHAVDARLAAQEPVRVLATHRDDRLAQAAHVAVTHRDRLPGEAVPLDEALVHAVQIGAEERRLVAAGAGTELEDGVAVVVWVAGKEQVVQLGLGGGDLAGKAGQVVRHQRRQLGIGLGGQLPSLFQLALEPPQALGGANHGSEPRVLPAEGAELRLVARHVGIGERVGYLLRPLQGLAESSLHGLGLGGLALVLAAEAVDASGGVDQALLAREVRVAHGAHFDVDAVGRRAGLEGVAAGAHRGDLLVLGMQICLHWSLLWNRLFASPQI